MSPARLEGWSNHQRLSDTPTRRNYTSPSALFAIIQDDACSSAVARGRSGASRPRGSSVKRARVRLRRVIIRAVCRFICPQEVLTGPSITPLQMSGHSEADGPVSASHHSLLGRGRGGGGGASYKYAQQHGGECAAARAVFTGSRRTRQLSAGAVICEPVPSIHPSISLTVAQGDQRELRSGDSCINFPLVEVN